MASGAFFVPADQTDFRRMVPDCRDKSCGANVAFADRHVSFRKWQSLGRSRKGPETPLRNQEDRAGLRSVLSALPSAREA